METTIKNILIPVDFSINTEVAISKTLELFGADPVHIHLLHIDKKKPSTSVALNNYIKLADLRSKIFQNCPLVNITFEASVNRSIQNCIAAKAKNRFELIIIGKNNSHPWLRFLTTIHPGKLSTQTNLPVLTVKPGALYHQNKTIVVPVNGSLPVNKITILETLCKNSSIKVYLLACHQSQQADEKTTSSVIQIYQWIRSSFHCRVEYASIISKGGGRSILNFAQKINADILLLQTEVETKIHSLNLHIQDVLPSQSKLQIFSV